MADLDRIRRKCSAAEREDLELLERAVADTRAAYQKGYAESDLKKWDAAKAKLDGYTAALEVKYFPAERTFPHRKAACDWLIDQGYKIGKSKFYADCDRGECVLEGDGTVRESALIAYAKQHLKQITDAAGDLTPLTEKKIRLENEKLEISNRRAKFEEEKDLGKWIRRSEHEKMMAVAFGVLDQLGQNFIRIEGPDVFSKIGGDTKKTTMGIDLLLAGWDKVMHDVSDPFQWDVTVREDTT